LCQISWFLAPTVALIEQQRDVIASAIPVPVGLISGASAPDQWKDRKLWSGILEKYRIMVSTPQILLDALRHGYIHLGRDISLLVFDEAHHATSKHPYNEIMKAFYHPLPPREDHITEEPVRPAVLGLTASPIYGGDIGKAFRSVSLDASIVTFLTLCAARLRGIWIVSSVLLDSIARSWRHSFIVPNFVLSYMTKLRNPVPQEC
jgi:endoribonuclease Dicer